MTCQNAVAPKDNPIIAADATITLRIALFLANAIPHHYGQELRGDSVALIQYNFGDRATVAATVILDSV
jgi:hypothetical protein